MPTPDRTSLAEIVAPAATSWSTAGARRPDHAGRRRPVGVRRAVAVQAGAQSRRPGRARHRGHRPRPRRAARRPIGAGADPRRDLAELARAFRAFAHARPAGYQLIFAPRPDAHRAQHSTALTHAVEPVLQVAANLAGRGSGPERRAHAHRVGERVHQHGAGRRLQARRRHRPGLSSSASPVSPTH